MQSASHNLTENHLNISSIPGMSELWNETLGEKDVCIAIIDSNIDSTHPSFKGADIRTIDLFNTENNSATGSGALEHGTSVASIVFGQHHSLIKGIAPDCKGIIIPVFGGREDKTSCSQLDLARAIEIASQNGAHIINISGGEFSVSGKSELLLAEAIQKCVKKGVLIISAAGNDGCECLHVPAAENDVLAVGAMDENNQPMDFRNWGKAYKSNGLLFPGKNILTALPGNEVAVKSGTSFATAVASGIAGLLLSLLVKNGQEPNGKSVFDALINSAFKCNESNNIDCNKALAGYVNVAGAVKEILNAKNILFADSLIESSLVRNDAFTAKTLLQQTSMPNAYTGHITPKKKTRLWNRLSIPN